MNVSLSATPEDLERLRASVSGSPGDLLLDSRPGRAGSHVGQLGAWFQLICTALRRGWRLGLTNADRPESALTHPVVRAISLLQSADEDLRLAARRIQHDELDWGCQDRTGAVGHLCLDGPGGLRSRFLYLDAGQVRPDDPRPFTNVVRRAVAYLSNLPLIDQLDEVSAEGLGQILFELFQNSHDYGRHSLVWRPLNPSLRGVAFSVHDGTESVFTAHSLRSAWADRIFRGGGRVLELVVFDSGIGLPLGWNRLPASAGRGAEVGEVPFETEAFRVESCLQKHRASTKPPSTGPSRESDYIHRGMGLFESLIRLSDLGGFWEVATAHVRLVRDLADKPLLAEEANARPQGAAHTALLTRESSRPLPYSAGTCFTLLVPLSGPVPTREATGR